MNRDEKISPAQIDAWAAQQLADYDARNPGTMFSEKVELSVPQAYDIQTAVAQRRNQRGEQIIGYKVGCTSPTIRRQLGIDHCVSGRLFDSEQKSSGVTLYLSDFANLAIEGELAVELARAPDENIDDFSGETLPACVAKVIPVIELHQQVMRGEQPSAAELIANNAIHAGVVLGSDFPSPSVQDSAAMKIFIDGELTDQYQGPSLRRTIASSLKWLSELVGERGEVLRPGQLILTGAIPSLIPIKKACNIRVDATPFGCVTARVS